MRPGIHPSACGIVVNNDARAQPSVRPGTAARAQRAALFNRGAFNHLTTPHSKPGSVNDAFCNRQLFTPWILLGRKYTPTLPRPERTAIKRLADQFMRAGISAWRQTADSRVGRRQTSESGTGGAACTGSTSTFDATPAPRRQAPGPLAVIRRL